MESPRYIPPSKDSPQQSEILRAQEKSLLPRAEPAKQMQACADTLSNLLTASHEKLEPAEEKIVQEMATLAMACAENPQCRTDAELSNRIVKTTVEGILNTFVIDEMHPFRQKGLGKRSYGREGWMYEGNQNTTAPTDFLDHPLPSMPKDVQGIHFTTTQETADFTNRLEGAHAIPVQSIEELRTHFQQSSQGGYHQKTYYFSSPLSIKEIQEAIALQQKQDKFATVILPFQLNETYAGYALVGANLKADEAIFYPQSEPARQEILEAVLQGGEAVIRSAETGKISANPSPSSSEETRTSLTQAQAIQQLNHIWDEIIQQVPVSDINERITVKQAYIYAMTSEEKSSKLAQQLRERLMRSYQSVMGKEYLLNANGQLETHTTDIYLTRSGVSAVALGIRAAAGYLGNSKETRPHAYIDKGFYFEDEKLAMNEFNRDEDYQNPETQIYCLCVAPNPPYESNIQNPPFEQQREQTARYVLEHARTTPDKDYFLIIDKTTNLLYQTFPEDEVLPPNLHVFEAASLTKHRRGDQKHFSGVIAYKGDAKLHQFIEKSLANAHALVSDRDLHFFHNVSRDEIAKNIEAMQAKSNAFTQAFNEAMESLPEQWRWKIERYEDAPQYAFLIPPMQAMIELTKHKKGFSKSLNIYADEGWMRPQKNKLSNIYQEYEEYFKSIMSGIYQPIDEREDLKRGDSFGLNDTRVTTIPAEFFYKDYTFKQPVPRVSFGLQTSEEQAREIAKAMAIAEEKKMEEIYLDVMGMPLASTVDQSTDTATS